MDTLLPCPFCGGEAQGWTNGTDNIRVAYIRCNCGVRGPENVFIDREVDWNDAIATWNTRTPSGLSLPESDSADHLGVVIGRKAGGE